MNREEFLDILDKYQSSKFDDITNKLSNRRDLHAFILIDKLVSNPQKTWIIECADHDIIYLSTSIEELCKAGITKEQVIELSACGVEEDNHYLVMFT